MEWVFGVFKVGLPNETRVRGVCALSGCLNRAHYISQSLATCQANIFIASNVDF